MLSLIRYTKRFYGNPTRAQVLKEIEDAVQKQFSEIGEEPELVVKEESNFIDNVRSYMQAGNGGNGCVSFRREKYIPRGPANGGNGGKGGDIILQTSTNVSSLKNIKHHYYAPHGEGGAGRGLHGKNGNDLAIYVPVGTLVKEWFPQTKSVGNLIVDLDKPNMQYLLCKGGYGGRGNSEFSSSVRRTPLIKETGQPGELKTIELELKILADVGLVGFPNAGKSTLLTALSNATPKVANYAFTTLRPHIGIIDYKDYSQVRVADLPGLIEGAHQNRGLGHQFLKHIERTRALCYVIDVCHDNDPFKEYKILRKEIELYNPELLTRPSVLVANKMDLPSAKAKYLTFYNQFVQQSNMPIIPISAQKQKNVEDLKKLLHSIVFTEGNNNTS